MAVDPELILKDLKANKYAPIYFLQGDEPYYIDQISNHIENNCLPEHEKSFNQTILYGKDTNTNTVIQRARQFPMMAERTLILVKEAQEMSDLEKEAGAKLLEAYVQNPLPSTVLVFCYKNKKLDARKALTKTIDKHTKLVTSEKIKDYKLDAWVESYFASKQLKTTKKACHIIAENIGNDLNRIVNEIDKILINVDAKTTIDENIVEKYIGISKEFNVFELQNALLKKDIYKSNLIIKHFQLNPKANPLVMVVTSLFSCFSKLLLTHSEEDKSENSLSKVLMIHPFIVKDYLTASKMYNYGKSIDIIGYLKQADLRSKGVDSGNMTDEDIMKELVYKILH